MINIEKLKSIMFYSKITEEEYIFLKKQFPWIESKKEGIYCLRENITNFPKCEYNHCENKRKFQLVGSKGYSLGCNKDHTTKLVKLKKYGVDHHMKKQEVKEKIKQTNIKKYGVENPGQIPETKIKVKDTVRKKYGCDNVFQAKEIKEKTKKTMVKKYGVEYSSQRKEYRELVKQTSLKNFGTEYPMQSEQVKNTLKKSMLKKYGVENIGPITRDKALKTMIKKYGCHSSQSPIIKEKIKQTCLERYGVEYALLNKEIKSKIKNTNIKKYGSAVIFKSNHFTDTMIKKYGVEHSMQSVEIIKKQQKSCYNLKEYKWNTGEISMVQGYEPIVLRELEQKGYTFKDILTDVSDMPSLFYKYKNKKHRYYPDVYIPKENLIIEVKSQYILEKQLEKNKLKFQAVKDAGFNFKLEVR